MRTTCQDSEQIGGAALDGEGTGNRGDDSGKKLKNLDDSFPIDFHNEQNNKGYQELKNKSRSTITQIPYMTINDITYQIRGAVFDVYKGLGPGLLESVYEEALVFELEQRGLKVETQKQVPIVYKGNVLKTELRLDLIVEDNVIVELKSVDEMKKVFSKQLLTYLRLMNKKVGLLVNFKTDDILNSIYRIANGAD